MFRQQQPLAWAMRYGAPAISWATEPFAVLLPDDLMVGSPAPWGRMMMAYREPRRHHRGRRRKSRKTKSSAMAGQARRGERQHHRSEGRGGKAATGRSHPIFA